METSHKIWIFQLLLTSQRPGNAEPAFPSDNNGQLPPTDKTQALHFAAAPTVPYSLPGMPTFNAVSILQVEKSLSGSTSLPAGGQYKTEGQVAPENLGLILSVCGCYEHGYVFMDTKYPCINSTQHLCCIWCHAWPWRTWGFVIPSLIGGIMVPNSYHSLCPRDFAVPPSRERMHFSTL